MCDWACHLDDRVVRGTGSSVAQDPGLTFWGPSDPRQRPSGRETGSRIERFWHGCLFLVDLAGVLALSVMS